MILSENKKMMLCESLKTSPYLILTLNLIHIIYLIYTYSYKLKYKYIIKLTREAYDDSL